MAIVKKECTLSLEVFDKYPKHTEYVMVQGDVGANVLLIDILYKGAPYDLTNLTTTITFKKEDGNVVVGSPTTISASEGKIRYELGTQEVAYVGRVLATVEIYDSSSNRITTSEFTFDVRAQLDDGTAIESTSEYPMIAKLLGASAKEDARIEQENERIASENVRQSNESTRQSQESLRQTNETARINAEGDATKGRVKAENDRVSAESARKTSETSRVNAENARVTAENGRVSAENARAANETTRQNNEATRQSQEQDRQTNTQNAINNLNNAVNTTKIVYKAPVATHSDIATIYPSPSIGWRVETTDTKKVYRYNGLTWEYIADSGIGYTAENVANKGIANGYAGLGSDGKVPASQLPSLDYIPNFQKGVANGVATLGSNGKVPSTQLPSLDYIPTSEKGVASGVATLGTDGKVPSAQLPPLDYIPTSQKGVANGVASLGSDGKVASSQLPPLNYAPSSHTSQVATSTTLGHIKSGGDITVAVDGTVNVNDDSHNHVISNIDGLQTALDDKASTSHNHDDRYYTEAEIDIKLAGLSISGHNHNGIYSPVGHTHDDRYYTETEIDNLLNTKINKSGDTMSGTLISPTYKSGNISLASHIISGETTEIMKLQRDGADYTIFEIASPNVMNGSFEATLALMREFDGGAEFLDLYNTGYADQNQFGLRLQKRGTGILKDFVIDYYDGATRTEVMRFNPWETTLSQPLVITNDNSIYLRGDSDRILDFRTSANVREGYVGRVLTDGTPYFVLRNAVSGKGLYLIDDGSINYSGSPIWHDNDISGAISGLKKTNLTANMALISDANGKITTSSSITATELGYLDGVTSNIQTQLNGKASSSHSHSYLPLGGGTLTGLLGVTLNGQTVTIGSLNSSYCHYETTAPNHWFNKDVRVQGEIYAGASYNQKVWHTGNLNPNDYASASHSHDMYPYSYICSGGITLNDSSWVRGYFNKTLPWTPKILLTCNANVAGNNHGKARNVNTTGFDGVIGGTGTSALYGYLAICY